MSRSDSNAPHDSGAVDRTRYWLDRRANRSRTHFGRGPSPEEAAIEGLVRDWYGSDLADAEIAARRSPAVRAGDIIDAVIERIGLARDLHLYRLQQRWKEIVGPAVAAQTMPVKIDARGVLVIEVANPVWLYNLKTFQQKELLQAVRAKSDADVSDVRFVPGGRRRPSRGGY